MPYLALLDDIGNELSAPDYVRRDLSDVIFKVSPSSTMEEIVFVNISTIDFKAESEWAWVAQIGLCDDVYGDKPFAIIPIEHGNTVPAGGTLRVPPGRLTISTNHIRPSGRRVPEPPPLKKRRWWHV